MNFEIEGIKGLAIYEYNPFIKDQLFLFKGCYDYELYNIFIEQFKKELRAKYRSFTMIPIPSNEDDDQKRGFNHVREIFKVLNITSLMVLKKTNKDKQANKNYYQRISGINNLELIKENEKRLVNKNILIVDDVCTTGTTLKNAISLIKPLNPKKIEILVVAKRVLTKEENALYSKNSK